MELKLDARHGDVERPLVDGERKAVFFTVAPSTKFTWSMKPETRGRTSPDLSATKRPEYSSHVVKCGLDGCAALTGMSCASSALTALDPPSAATPAGQMNLGNARMTMAASLRLDAIVFRQSRHIKINALGLGAL
jgi:hypothetical protein